MNLNWEYHTENFNSDNVVATLYKRKNIPVLQVYEGRDCYFSRPYGEYAQHIDMIKVPYEVADRFLSEQKDIIAAEEKEISEVKYVCTLFESNFKMQVNMILSLFA